LSDVEYYKIKRHASWDMNACRRSAGSAKYRFWLYATTTNGMMATGIHWLSKGKPYQERPR